MRQISLIIIMQAIHLLVYSQDTIINRLGEKMVVQIIDTSGDYVSYIPVSSINKNKIERIVYFNEKDQHAQKTVIFQNKESRSQKELLAVGNRVYIRCSDNGGRIHTNDAIAKWDYWKIVETPETCDFILNMDITLKGKAEAHVTLLSAVDHSIILDVPKCYVLFGDYGNPKRAAIIKTIGEKMIPMIKDIEK